MRVWNYEAPLKTIFTEPGVQQHWWVRWRGLVIFDWFIGIAKFRTEYQAITERFTT